MNSMALKCYSTIKQSTCGILLIIWCTRYRVAFKNPSKRINESDKSVFRTHIHTIHFLSILIKVIFLDFRATALPSRSSSGKYNAAKSKVFSPIFFKMIFSREDGLLQARMNVEKNEMMADKHKGLNIEEKKMGIFFYSFFLSFFFKRK